jgi:hypothetical protein
MKSEAAPTTKNVDLPPAAHAPHRDLLGKPHLAWLLVTVANFIFQATFYREMTWDENSAGEFGLFNAALGIIGFLTVPLLAVHHAFYLYPICPSGLRANARLESLRSSSVIVVESFAWVWGGFCLLLTLLTLPLSYLPRLHLSLFAFFNVLLALGAILSRTIYENKDKQRQWVILFVSATLVRVIFAAIGAVWNPFDSWADAGLATFLIAGFITLTPALRPREVDWSTRLKALQNVVDREFLLFAGATFSVLLGLFLFTNADRFVSIGWMVSNPGAAVHMTASTEAGFDSYQASGLLGRALLWGTQPLLWILFAQRARLNKTIPSSLFYFWIYLGALIGGAFLLGLLTQQGSLRAMGHSFQVAGFWAPTFAVAMIPLGLLQGLGIFSLASRRYAECFVIGACSVGYTLILILFGRQPELMLAYMFGASVISLMIVLFVGVVRWGRLQP